MIDLRATDDYKVNQRRSMAVGPYEDLPPHLRNHLVSFFFGTEEFERICMGWKFAKPYVEFRQHLGL